MEKKERNKQRKQIIITEEDESEIGMRESEKENGMKDEDESMKDKTIQMKLPAFWAGNTTNSPRTPASSRTASPARVRRLEDISPCENENTENPSKFMYKDNCL